MSSSKGRGRGRIADLDMTQDKEGAEEGLQGFVIHSQVVGGLAPVPAYPACFRVTRRLVCLNVTLQEIESCEVEIGTVRATRPQG